MKHQDQERARVREDRQGDDREQPAKAANVGVIAVVLRGRQSHVRRADPGGMCVKAGARLTEGDATPLARPVQTDILDACTPGRRVARGRSAQARDARSGNASFER